MSVTCCFAFLPRTLHRLWLLLTVHRRGGLLSWCMVHRMCTPLLVVHIPSFPLHVLHMLCSVLPLASLMPSRCFVSLLRLPLLRRCVLLPITTARKLSLLLLLLLVAGRCWRMRRLFSPCLVAGWSSPCIVRPHAVQA